MDLADGDATTEWVDVGKQEEVDVREAGADEKVCLRVGLQGCVSVRAFLSKGITHCVGNEDATEEVAGVDELMLYLRTLCNAERLGNYLTDPAQCRQCNARTGNVVSRTRFGLAAAECCAPGVRLGRYCDDHIALACSSS